MVTLDIAGAGKNSLVGDILSPLATVRADEDLLGVVEDGGKESREIRAVKGENGAVLGFVDDLVLCRLAFGAAS